MKNDFKEFMDGFKAMFTDLKTKEGRRKQIPNWITFSRLVISCFIPPLAMSGNLIALGWASGLAAVALGTDFVDGKLARKLNVDSEFGKNLDPVCDKLAAAILLAPLMIKVSPLSPWLCVNLGLEAGIALVNLNSKAKGNKPETTLWGKGKTASLSVLLVLSYLSFSIPGFASAIPCIEGITLGLQTITLFDYKRIDKKQDRKRKLIEITESVENEDPIEDEQPIIEIGTKDDIIIAAPELGNQNTTKKIETAIIELKKLKDAVIGTSTPSDEILKPVEEDKIMLL